MIIKDRMIVLIDTRSNNLAKAFLKDDNRKRAVVSAMNTTEATDLILQRSSEYIVGLMEFNLYNSTKDSKFGKGTKKSPRRVKINSSNRRLGIEA